ncbi:MAG: dTDP-4-dehydrorhamnose reductase [Calditrichaeota bacterium]|nr:dTDP-4-dehydrorhamnose reductase [Calditrichota bacterium]
MKNRYLIVGCNGLLGQKIVREISKQSSDSEILGTSIEPSVLFSTRISYQRIDITKIDSVHRVVREFRPTVIVNAAAYTNVDRAEIDQDLCWEINVIGVENLALEAKAVGAMLYHVSTDYVFSGENGPYRETDTPDPRGFYARSKLAAEWAIEESGAAYFIGRTSTLFGAGENIRPNFVLWLISALKKNQEVTIVDDQIGNPTLADNLAEAFRVAIEKKATGLFHLAGRESIDRYSFALKIARIFNLNQSLIHRGKTSDLKQLAPRPMNAALSVEKAQKELGVYLMSVEEELLELKKQLDEKHPL